jgi:UPF0755 protein
MKKILKIFIFILLIALIGTGIFAFTFYRGYRRSIEGAMSESDETVEFIIEEGESLDSIAERLQEENLIKNELYFRIYLKQEDIETKIQAGKFQIPKNSTMKEVTGILQNAKKPDIWVTIPEGLMATEIADILEEGFNEYTENSFDKTEFLNMVEEGAIVDEMGIPKPADKPLEGYLFPDTYRFPADANAEYVLNTILTKGFRDKIYNIYAGDIAASQFSLYEILTLASILERETKYAQDRPLVADILIRRINNNWRLDVDATLLYYFDDWTHEITYQDLQIDSQYNTRKVAGFPPTPISNPGQEAIYAILDPEPNDYWYYVSDSEGNLHYAVTEYEQNLNIQKYIYGQ